MGKFGLPTMVSQDNYLAQVTRKSFARHRVLTNVPILLIIHSR